MIKIGTIGWDNQLQRLTNLLKNMEGFAITGCLSATSTNAILPETSDIISYPSFEAFFRYVDAVAIVYKSHETFETICHCLKHFKHVFLIGAQYLKYNEFTYILKIAEESNVRFYPEFGGIIPDISSLPLQEIRDVQFIDIHQTFNANEGICEDGRMSVALLKDVFFISKLVKANVKKISANGWGFCEPGAGMLNAKIDFDNGASANLLLANSVKPKQMETVIYGRHETIRLNSIDEIFKISCESFVKRQIDNREVKFSADSYLRYELKEFLSAIFQNKNGLDSIDNKYKSFSITHLIQEKINHFAAINIFYS